MTHVPYKGGAPANQDLLGGRVDIFITVYGKNYQQWAETGKIKILALLNSERREGFKQYPAIAETKPLKDFTFNLWTGYFLLANGMQPAKPVSLADAGKFYADQAVKFRAIAKSIGLEPQ